MAVRIAAVAGRFYEASHRQCLAHLKQLLPSGPIDGLPDRILAGIVPHAGWVFSGEVAGLVFAAVKQRHPRVDTFLVLGACHTVHTRRSLLYDSGQWGTPLGTIDIDADLSAALQAEDPDRIVADREGHRQEHSIEVQVPFIQYLFPEAALVALLVPPTDDAPEVGRAVARAVARSDKRVVCIASSDLTHYGPSYAMTPMGTGPEGIAWAKDQNDRLFLDQALAFQADQLVATARSYGSACGAGAVAAVVAAAKELGASQARLLAHTTSAEVMARKFGQEAHDSVGYAAVVYG